jgi:hypothetical protein
MPKLSRRKPASGLEALQRAITGALMKPLNADESMTPANRAVAEKFIKPNDRLTAFERLQIYNQQYWWRLLSSLAEDFRGVRAVLGERKFDRLANAYLEAHPSTSWTLRNIGSKLVVFIEANPKLTHPRNALAIDVARVEWARVLAFDEPSQKIIAPEKMARTAPDRLRLALQPYIVLLELSHPVDELMSRLKRAEFSAVSNAVASSGKKRARTVTVRRSRKPVFLAVHRLDNSVYFKRHEPEAHAILLALRSGATLGAACETAFAGSKDSPEKCAAKIREWFSRWAEFGWFCEPAKRRGRA